MKVLWLSRHDMTPEQVRGLQLHHGIDGNVEIVKVNMTFPADSYDAALSILNTAREQGFSVIAGVFPAHIAARLALLRRREVGVLVRVLIPVSVPVPAKDGETRGFQFSHWERF